MFLRKRVVVGVSVLVFVVGILAASASLGPLLSYPRPINYVRRLVWSRSYKAEVPAQRNSANGELKHIEWDAWGWGGEDTTAYLVFDPDDSLSAASQEQRPDKFKGVPCKVPLVERMEKNW